MVGMTVHLKISFLLLVVFAATLNSAQAKAGFSLPDSMTEFSLHYKAVENLIILPVKINDDVEVNLILDTGCRNLVLFGKRFTQLFSFEHGRAVQFSGMGYGKPVEGTLSINNHVAIGPVTGHSIPIIVVPSKNILVNYPQVHGIIGYDIFARFEIELNPSQQLITFRSPGAGYVPNGYTKIPMDIKDSKPLIQSAIVMGDSMHVRDLLIDTGSAIGLLLKSTQTEKFSRNSRERSLGVGLNGSINGFVMSAKSLIMGELEIRNLEANVTHSPWHNYASIGMGILKDYTIILNYAQSYACLRKV